MPSGTTHDPSSNQTSAPESEPLLLPASFAQELLWITDRASPGSVAYNVPRTRRLVGPLDVDALRRAFDALVERHEILRTTYATIDDQAVQAIHPPRPVPFDVVDLSTLPADARDAEATRIVRERAARPFDLATDLLLRVTVIRYSADEHVLFFESHHIAFDGWSRDVVFRDLAGLYAAFVAGAEDAEEASAALPPLPIQYADYAIWQREHLKGARLDALLDYWRRELGDAEHVLRLPTDFPRPAVSRYEGVTHSLRLSAETRDAVRALGQRHEATLYMVLLAAYTTVLHRYTGQPDVLVGSPIAGRARPETEGLIGYFANTIVQRARFANDPTFGEVLRRLRESALGAYDHQDVPFEKLVLELEGRAALGTSPVFQVVFTQLDASQAPDARMGDVRLSSFALDGNTTKFDLTLFMSDRPDGLELSLRGRTDLHRPETIARFLAHMRNVLDAAVADAGVHVSQIALLTDEERAQLAAWNDTARDLGAPTTLVALFEAQAARVGEREAIAGALTYRQLDARANQLARHLAAAGVAPNARVGLLLDRSADAIVGLLGILKAGGAYVPLSVDAPAARLAQQIRECGAKVVVTASAHADRVPPTVRAIALDAEAATLGALADGPLGAAPAPDDLAYVLYTSGSTGTPKGVAVTHANAVHYARAVSQVLAGGLDGVDGWHFGLASTLAADLGNTSLLPSLLGGGTLHVLAKDVTTEPARYAEYVAAHPLDVLKITPNHFQALSGGKRGGELAAVLPRQWLVTGGEALRIDLARTVVSAGQGRLLNHYGPTETTVGVCTFEVTTESLAEIEAAGAQTVPIGRPLANTRAYVVDAHDQLVPVGVPGELLLGGDGVARGYLDRDDLTAERFVDETRFATRDSRLAMVYRTGDRVRRLRDGAIEFLGRGDDQVKVRGYRVELGEITQTLRANPGVEQGVVVLRAVEGAEPALVAYAVPKQAGYAVSHSDRPTSEKITQWLAAQLPEYMVPSAVVLVEALPLTPNGKVDTAALPAPDATEAAADRYVAPSTPTEEQLAAIWCDVLKKERVGATDNFLDLGGHSLMAIRVLGKISKTFGVRLPIRALFEAPTVTQLAEVVDVELKLAALENMSDEEAARLLGSMDEAPKV